MLKVLGKTKLVEKEFSFCFKMFWETEKEKQI